MTQPAATAARLDLWPVPEPLVRLTAPLRQEALAASKDPTQVWETFRRVRRSSASPLVRAAALIDDAYRTAEPEYLDLPEFPAESRQKLLAALDRFHQRLGTYGRLCQILVPVVAASERRRVLELASGHGQLAIALDRELEAVGISAAVEGSDLAPELVELARENAAAAGRSTAFRVLDATQLAVPDDSYDVAFNALAMHHFPFEMVVKVLRELRRVARTAVIIDLYRSPLLYLPGGLLVGAVSGSLGCVHDGMISLRKAWGMDEWRLALELAGWERASFGLSPPSYLVLRLDRA